MPFEACPPEVIELIVKLLPLHDNCNLRLTSRSLASKATQDHFKANFQAKRVELSRTELHKLVTATESPGLVCLLRQLTLVAPVYNPSELEARLRHKAIDIPSWDEDGLIELKSQDLGDEDLRRTKEDLHKLRQLQSEHSDFIERKEDVALLRQALTNLSTHGVTFRSISTHVAVYRIDAITPIRPLYGGGWRHIWKAAAEGVKCLFESLANSGLCVEELDLFSSSEMQRCSLACDQLSSIDFDSASMRSCLENVQVLSMSISDKVIRKSQREPTDFEDYSVTNELESFGRFRSSEDILEEASAESSFSGLSSMLRHCHQLQDLDISHSELDCTTHEVTLLHSERILQAVEHAQLLSIRSLGFEGFEASEAQFLRLLHSLPALQTLSLRYIRLHKGGSWGHILDHCTAESEQSLTEMRLDAIF